MRNTTTAATILLALWVTTAQAQGQSIPSVYDLSRFDSPRGTVAFNVLLELHFGDTGASDGTVSGCMRTLNGNLLPLSGTWSWYQRPRMLVSLTMPFLSDTVEIVGILLPAPDDDPTFSFRGHWLNGFLGSGAFDAESIIPGPTTQPEDPWCPAS